MTAEMRTLALFSLLSAACSGGSSDTPNPTTSDAGAAPSPVDPLGPSIIEFSTNITSMNQN